MGGGVVNGDLIRLHTSGVLRARQDYRERTKCIDCGDFKPVLAPGVAAYSRCDECREQHRPKTKRRRRAA